MSGIITFTKNKYTGQTTELPLREIYLRDNLQILKADPMEIQSLAMSIGKTGVITPLLVKATEKGYEVTEGADRYYAAKINGMTTVPCRIQPDDEYKLRFYRQISEIQSQDLNFFQEAEGIEKLISLYGMTQEDAASCLGKAQSTIANKLRLLRLTEEERVLVTENHLTERHARALLRIASPQERMYILKQVIDDNLNVEKTEQAVEKVIGRRKRREPYRRRSRQGQSVRAFIDMIAKGAEGLTLSGIPVKTERISDEDGIELRIHVAKDIEPQ